MLLAKKKREKQGRERKMKDKKDKKTEGRSYMEKTEGRSRRDKTIRFFGKRQQNFVSKKKRSAQAPLRWF